MAALDLTTLFSLKGKTALVTGGSRGIGKMITQGFLEAGAKVYITARKAKACDAAAQELSQFGTCISIPADIGTPEGRKQLLETFSAAEKQLHILVNNAGKNWGEAFETFPDKAFDDVMHLNVGAVFSMTRDFCNLLATGASAKDPARVINIGSMDGLHATTVAHTGTFAYSASKAAVHHLTRGLAIELAPRHITVNAIAPGFFPSKMTDFVFDKYKQDIEENCPLKRVGQEEEMAGVAIYLSSRAGAYTNGVVIPVDGGTSINHQHVKV
ncbi:MAG: SDR family oxidoreductase [SAR324 cluster bacterium]|nr:SDR family oxidoreductase [SAR324 cluster bacterium]